MGPAQQQWDQQQQWPVENPYWSPSLQPAQLEGAARMSGAYCTEPGVPQLLSTSSNSIH